MVHSWNAATCGNGVQHFCCRHTNDCLAMLCAPEQAEASLPQDHRETKGLANHVEASRLRLVILALLKIDSGRCYPRNKPRWRAHGERMPKNKTFIFQRLTLQSHLNVIHDVMQCKHLFFWGTWHSPTTFAQRCLRAALLLRLSRKLNGKDPDPAHGLRHSKILTPSMGSAGALPRKDSIIFPVKVAFGNA